MTTKTTSISIAGLLLAAGLSLLSALPARAQAAGEYAGATSGMASVAVFRPGVPTPSAPASRPASTSAHLSKPAGPPPEVLNREWFRQLAGNGGISVHLASEPAGASLWVDGRFVGQTPLELVLPAGRHQVRLLGPHLKGGGFAPLDDARWLALFLSFCVTLHAQILRPNPKWPTDQEFLNINRVIEEAIRSYPNVEEELVWALIWEESKYDPLASGLKGELGLGQLMPATARALGVRDRTNIKESVDATVRHLSYLLRKYNGNRPLALAAYNAGEPLVDRCRCVPTASRGYVNRIDQNRFFAKRIVEYVRTALVPAQSQQARIQDLELKLASLEQERLRISDSSQVAVLQDELTRTQTALQSARADAERLRREAEQLKAQLEEENSLAAQAYTMADSLRRRLDEVEKRINEARPRGNEEAVVELGSIRAEIAEIKKAVQDAGVQDNRTQQQIADLSATIARLSDRVSTASPDGQRPLVIAERSTTSRAPLVALVAITARGSRFEPDPALTGALQDALLRRGLNVSLELQAPRFLDKNVRSLLAGDGRALEKARARKGPNWHYVFILTVSSQPGESGFEGTTSILLAGDSKLYTAKGNLIAMKDFSGVGAGFSALQAHQMATARLARAVGDYLEAVLPR